MSERLEKAVKVSVLSVMVFLIAIAGFSYAYFNPTVQGNEQASSMGVTTKPIVNNSPIITLTNDQGSSGLDNGDMVTISRGNNISENFYVVSTDASETVLLAQYNLLVGDVEEYDENEIYSASPLPVDSNYGLQSVNAKANDENSNQWIGTVAFSGSNYWHNEATDEVYSKYGTYTDYENDVYDPNYNEPPSTDYSDEFPVPTEENYSIAYYVEEYVNTLGINGTGRLLRYSEAISLGCITSANCFSAPSWVYTSSYFLGSVTSAENVWVIDSSGYFIGGEGLYNAGGIYGVRPVIVVSTADINID